MDITELQQIQTIAMLAGLFVLYALESARPFFEFFKARQRERTGHALRNLLLGALNAGMIALVFVGLWFGASTWAEQRDFGLLNWLSVTFDIPWWTHAIGAIVLLDAWMYVWHRINHMIPFLWRFHRVHHSDRKMDVTTAGRFHIGEIAFSSLLRIPLILLLGLQLSELLMYETAMFAVVQFHHANIALPERIDRFLRALIVTPAMHKVHHSDWQPETDSNYSSLFSVWDRIGRSFRLRKELSAIQFGLEEIEGPEESTIPGMLRTPFSRLIQKDHG